MDYYCTVLDPLKTRKESTRLDVCDDPWLATTTHTPLNLKDLSHQYYLVVQVVVD